MPIAQYTYAYEYMYPVKLHTHTHTYTFDNFFKGETVPLILDMLRLSLFYRWQAYIKLTASHFSKVGQTFNFAIE